MKLKFTIHYHTAWGERLHVVVGYHHQDGSCKQQNLTMQTDDGRLWTLETAVLVSLRHPLSHIEYHYQVESGEGEVVRREWTLVPRRYYFDADGIMQTGRVKVDGQYYHMQEDGSLEGYEAPVEVPEEPAPEDKSDAE